MAAITLDQADRLAGAALDAGRETDCRPLTVAVLDPGGHLVVLKRQDDSGIMRPQIATGKAWGALGMGVPTRSLAGLVEQMPPAFSAALPAVSGGRFVPVPGGVLIRDTQGTLLGAVGISGDVSDKDEVCAVAGIRAVGLVADDGAS